MIRAIPFGRPWITDADRAAVMKVLEGHILTHGPNCTAFEGEFVAMMGDGFAATTSSCMASLHLSYIHLGVGPGDEVIVPAQTHVATVHAVELTGATPVFVDCELDTGNMDLTRVEAAVTPRTRALSVVHFNGIPVAMDQVMAIAEAPGLAVVEDCALAVGARFDGRHVGLFGHTGCYSFYPVKHITTGEGGMIVSNNPETIGAIASFRAFSVDRTHTERRIPGIYDVNNVGMNYRMSEMQAALGRTQVAKVPLILERRTHIDSLMARLNEPRIRKVIEPMLLGERAKIVWSGRRQLKMLTIWKRMIATKGRVRAWLSQPAIRYTRWAPGGLSAPHTPGCPIVPVDPWPPAV